MNRQKRQTLMVALVLLVSPSLIAVACGGGAATPAPAVTVTAAPSPAPAVTVTVTPTPTPTAKKAQTVVDAEATGGRTAFLMSIGVAQGLFAKRGIDLQVKEMSAAAARVAPFLGQSDIGAGGIMNVIEDAKGGVPVRIIGPHLSGHFSIVVQQNSPYKSIEDLKGKKVGSLGPATAAYTQTKITFKLYGLDWEKDLTLVTGDVAVLSGWIEKGEVEAALLYDPYTSKLLATGKIRELAFINDVYKAKTGDPLLVGGYYTHAIWAKERPELAKDVGQGWAETLRYVYDHPEVFKSEQAAKVWKIDDKNVLEITAQRFPRTITLVPYGPQYKAALKKQVTLAEELGVMAKGSAAMIDELVLFAD